MAAEVLASRGVGVTVLERMPSPARKLLMAGRGGLNLTHSEPWAGFVQRYGAAREWLEPAIQGFGPEALKTWCAELGIETFVGSSGRVFPKAMKASPLLRAWRRLPPAKRSRFVVMLKTGTYDDTVASHYALLHPLDDAGPDVDDPLLLDPAQPLDDDGPWRLSDSAAQITSDPDILEAWNTAGITPTQLGGVWVFVRWNDARDRSLLSPLVHAWAQELARGP
jgi:hypothetical protein